MFNEADLTALAITLKLALVTTVVLLLLGTPLAWWLARTRSRLKPLVASLAALPLVLPPSVLGFYLLLLMGPQGPLGFARLPFTFGGLVVASVIIAWHMLDHHDTPRVLMIIAGLSTLLVDTEIHEHHATTRL